MSRLRVLRRGLLLGVAVLPALLVAAPAAAGSLDSLDTQTVHIQVNVQKFASLNVREGSMVSFGYQPVNGSRVFVSRALVVEVTGNTDWKVRVYAESPVPVRLAPARLLHRPEAQGRSPVMSSTGAFGPRGSYVLAWDVEVDMPPGAPAGVYTVQFSLELSAL